MKTVLSKYIAFVCIALTLLASCKKDGLKTIATTNGKGGTLTSNTTSLVLDKNKKDDTTAIIKFNIASPNYGYKAAVTNTLQVDSMGDNWKNPANVTLGANQLLAGYSTTDFNALLLKVHLNGGISSKVQVRIQSTISPSVAVVYSNALTLDVTPYNLSVSIYVAGAYEGWTVPSANLDSLVSATGNGIFTGIINFTPGNLDFKIIPTSKNFNGNYGGGTAPGTITQGDGNPPNLTAPAPGGLLLTVNLNNSTITYTPQWSIIGDGTPGGWGTDTNMEFDVVHNTWFITATLVGDGSKALKFRFANDWTINLGGSGGTLSSGGANIIVPATPAAGALYKITLDPVANTYTLVKQ